MQTNFCYLLECLFRPIYLLQRIPYFLWRIPRAPNAQFWHIHFRIQRVGSIWKYHAALVLLSTILEISSSKVRFHTLWAAYSTKTHPQCFFFYFDDRNHVTCFYQCCFATSCIYYANYTVNFSTMLMKPIMYVYCIGRLAALNTIIKTLFLLLLIVVVIVVTTTTYHKQAIYH